MVQKLAQGMSIAVVLAVSTALAGPEKPWRVYVGDEDYYTNIYGAKDMTRERVDAYVDNIALGGITHHFICPMGMVPCYDSKIDPPRWALLDEFKEEKVESRISMLRLLHERGVDMFAVWIEASRRRGISPWITMRMNDIHDVDHPHQGYVTRFWLDHPEYHRNPDLKSNGDWSMGGWHNGAFDFSHPEVRAHHLALVREMLERYDADGFECDWLRFAHHLPKGKEREYAHCLTEFMRDVRACADEVGKRRGRKIQVAARVSSSVECALGLGTDAVLWAREKIIDVLTVSSFFWSPDFDADFADWKRLIAEANPSVRVLVGVEQGLDRRRHYRERMHVADYAGYFDVAYAAGMTGGFAFFNPYGFPTDSKEWKFLMGGDLSSEAVCGMTRNYQAMTWRDAVPDDMPPEEHLPVYLDKRQTVGITVGRPQPDDRALVRLYQLDEEPKWDFPLAGALLNGTRPLKVVDRLTVEFPISAVKSGKNLFSIGPKAGMVVQGVSLTLKKSSGEQSVRCGK